MNVPPATLLAKGPQIVEAVAGGPLRTVKPYTREVRAEIDTNELLPKSIDFMKRQKAAGKPFFLYLPFSMGHFPNLPSKQFAGKSRIGQYGDKLMEGDHHVGQILDALKELGIDDNTLVVFASDNGPQGETTREMGNQGTPDMGNSGPFRGELGEATEGAIRTFCFVRWPGKVKPGTTSDRDVLDHGLHAHLRQHHRREDAHRPGHRRCRPDRCVVRQAETGNRDSLLTFMGADLVAVRWKQWRMYFTDVYPTGIGPQRQPGMFSAGAPMAGYPKVFNIEMDPHEDPVVGALFGVDGGTDARGGREIQADAQEVSEPSCGQPHEVLRKRET